jgi:dipeptidyl aminopeptidase/acylaminoacyl peptidase
MRRRIGRGASVGLLLSAAFVAIASCRATLAPTGPSPPAQTDAAGRPSAAAFFRDPLLSHVSLSPDGKHIAGVTARDGVQVLMVRRTWGGEIRRLAKLDEPGMALRTVGWAGNRMIVVGVDMPHQTVIGVRARQSRLLSVALDGSRPRYLGEDWPYQQYSADQDRVIDWLPDDPGHVLINWWQPDQAGVSARRVNVTTGSLQTVVPAKPWVTAWFADHQGRVRAGEGTRREGTSVIVYGRADGEAPFEKLGDFDWFTEKGFRFAGFDPDPKKLYVYAPTDDLRSAVFEYDLERRELRSLVYSHPDVDVGPLVHSPLDGRLLAIEVDAERPGLHFVDEEARHEQASIDAAFPGTVNRIVSFDREGKTAIVSVSGDTAPPEYYVYDRLKKQMDHLFAAYPGLERGALSPMRSVRYAARDGLEIQAYLTLPRDGTHNLPTIVYPHGGPTARDLWGWNATVQFLASRGFAVLQPNFRGSAGFGREHERKGYRQWGLAMQDDLADAVHWLVKEGIADPDRVGIYGASYGGYAALMGLVKTPELFRAGASFAAVTDLIAWLDDRERYLFSDFNTPVHGDSSDDREQLAATSPARHADRIRVPVLIAHGVQDPVVPVDEAHAMANALEEAGVEVETYLYRDEVHGFLDERNRIDFHEKLAAFFERHLAAK